MQRFPHISIITVNYNGSKDTIACLESLQTCTYQNFDIYVVDNGSENSDVETLKKRLSHFPQVIFIESKENLGFGGGNNLALEKIISNGKAEFVYFLNNDTTVDSMFLHSALEAIQSDEQCGIVASRSLQFGNRDYIENAGHLFLDCGDCVPRGRNKPKESYEKREEVLGACSAGALYKVTMLKETGFYDETFFMNYEDVDLSLRCILFGWKCIYEPKSIIYHKVNATVQKVRDYPFVLRSQQNQLRAYFYNTPLPVILVNLPFILLRDIFVVLVTFITLRWKITKVFLHAKLLFLKKGKKHLEIRKQRMKHKKISSWYILSKQRNFIAIYAGYFVDIILKNNLSFLETKKR